MFKTFMLPLLALLIFSSDVNGQLLDVSARSSVVINQPYHCCTGAQPLLFSQPMVVATGLSAPELPHLRVVTNGVLYYAGPSVKLVVSTGANFPDIDVSGGSGLVSVPFLFNHR